MTEQESQQATPETEPANTASLGGRARSLANLRPPWPKGRSANPAGRAADGGSAKDHPARALLRAKLAKRRALHRLIDRWIEDAIDAEDGATRAKAREQILVRIDPIVEDAAQGRVVLEGITLEVTSQGAALTIGQPSPSQPIDVPLLEPGDGSSSGESFAVEKA